MVGEGPPDPPQHPAGRPPLRLQGDLHRLPGAGRSRIPSGVFPMLPRQFTLTSTFTIGIPAFFLALAPSSGPWRPEGFLRAIARFSIPAGPGDRHRHPRHLPARPPRLRPRPDARRARRPRRRWSSPAWRSSSRSRTSRGRGGWWSARSARRWRSSSSAPARSRPPANSSKSPAPTGGMIGAWLIGSAVAIAC